MTTKELTATLSESFSAREKQLDQLVSLASQQAGIINHLEELLAGQDKRMNDTNEMLRTLADIRKDIDAKYMEHIDRLAVERNHALKLCTQLTDEINRIMDKQVQQDKAYAELMNAFKELALHKFSENNITVQK